MKKIKLRPKLLLGLVMMGVVLMLSLSFGIAHVYRAQMEEEYSKTAFDTAAIAASMIILTEPMFMGTSSFWFWPIRS